MEFTPDYFIDKFSAIPDHLWDVGSIGNYEGTEFAKKCALGLCGVSVMQGVYVPTEESDALVKLFGGAEPDGTIKNYRSVYAVNDALEDYRIYGSTPKERIINKLKEIKNATTATNG